MAGLGYKVFEDGNVLTATEVNGYMMEQMIMVFDNTAARDVAIDTPTEGMVSFTKDNDKLAYFDGSVWRNL